MTVRFAGSLNAAQRAADLDRLCADNLDVLQLDRAMVDDAIEVKLLSTMWLAQLVAPAMQARGWGRIITVAGSAGTDSESIPVRLPGIDDVAPDPRGFRVGGQIVMICRVYVRLSIG